MWRGCGFQPPNLLSSLIFLSGKGCDFHSGWNGDWNYYVLEEATRVYQKMQYLLFYTTQMVQNFPQKTPISRGSLLFKMGRVQRSKVSGHDKFFSGHKSSDPLFSTLSSHTV